MGRDDKSYNEIALFPFLKHLLAKVKQQNKNVENNSPTPFIIQYQFLTWLYADLPQSDAPDPKLRHVPHVLFLP